MFRPTPLVIDDDAPCRRDVDSDDVRRVFPELSPSRGNGNALLHECDMHAYRFIQATYPKFLPPGQQV